jgi:N-acetylmuramoyl-L-alanine amidase
MHGYPDFPQAQMRAVAALARDIARRHRIPPHRVLAHSDVAPERKIDPGEKFDWGWLAGEGVGLWVAPAPVDETDAGFPLGATSAEINQARELLVGYGYKLDPKGPFDPEMQIVVRAFQLHFRPARPDGRLDRSTLDTLSRVAGRLSPKDGPIV